MRMHIGTSTLEKEGIKQLISYRTVGNATNLQNPISTLLQNIAHSCAICAQGEPYEKSTETGRSQHVTRLGQSKSSARYFCRVSHRLIIASVTPISRILRQCIWPLWVDIAPPPTMCGSTGYKRRSQSCTGAPQGQGTCLSRLMASALNWDFYNLCNKLVQWRWFHHITSCVFIKGHCYNLCNAASHAMDRALQNVDYYYGLTDMAGLTIQHVVRNEQRFVRKLGILKHTDFWDVTKWLAGACKS